MMKKIKLKAKIRISTDAGNFSAGKTFEIDEIYAKRLIDSGYAEKIEIIETNNGNNNSIIPEKELEKLKVDELKELAETIGFNANELKKVELIKKIVEEAKKSDAFSAILEMDADEIREQLGE
jgi:demethoxyubiquinone hydroxylase (CLK1/Coq7/Cat5 family)